MDHLNILYVEDDDFSWKTVQALLNHTAITLERAKNIEEAKKILSLHKTDLMLLDLNLLETQGLDTIISIKADTNGTPIIVVSGVENTNSIDIKCLDHGADNFIQKKYLTRDALLEAIDQAVAHKINATKSETVLDLLNKMDFLIERLKKEHK